MNNDNIENELRSILSPNEKLVWVGKPKKGIIFRDSDYFLIPFSLVFLSFSIFFLIDPDTSFMFSIWGYVFLLIGIYFVVGRFFFDAKMRANTIYGITENTIVIMTGIFRRNFKLIDIQTLSDISLIQKEPNVNVGTIYFGRRDYRDAIMQGMEYPGDERTPKFELIEEVRNVYDKIKNSQNKK
jgi:hypothetical protein